MTRHRDVKLTWHNRYFIFSSSVIASVSNQGTCVDTVLPLLMNRGKNRIWFESHLGGRDIVMVVNKNTEGTIYSTQVLYWVDGEGGEECGKEERCCYPVCSQVWVRNVLLDSKTKPGRLRGWQVMGTSCYCTRVNTLEKLKTQLWWLDPFIRLIFAKIRIRIW